MAPSKIAENGSDEESPVSSPKSPSPSPSSDVDDNDDDLAADILPRATKRRRISVSSDDSYVAAPEPLPSLSRIKKKPQGTNDDSNKPEEPEPVTSQDALEIGLQVTNSTFSSLNVAPWLVGSLSAMAIRRPTAIQRACIPEILKGRDCIGGSRTGSGKTVAFAVPILQKWAEDPFGIFAIVLTPTRYVFLGDLATQVFGGDRPNLPVESLLFRFSSNSKPSPPRKVSSPSWSLEGRTCDLRQLPFPKDPMWSLLLRVVWQITSRLRARTRCAG
jgi:hypothetical protein